MKDYFCQSCKKVTVHFHVGFLDGKEHPTGCKNCCDHPQCVNRRKVVGEFFPEVKV